MFATRSHGPGGSPAYASNYIRYNYTLYAKKCSEINRWQFVAGLGEVGAGG
jgi:hypothetical protein